MSPRLAYESDLVFARLLMNRSLPSPNVGPKAGSVKTALSKSLKTGALNGGILSLFIIENINDFVLVLKPEEPKMEH